MSKFTTLLRYAGGKFYLRKWIISLFPPNYTQMKYLEPYCGAATICLHKERSLGGEIISDLNSDLINLLYSVREYPNFQYETLGYGLLLYANLYSQQVFDNAKEKLPKTPMNMDRAICYYLVNRMSRNGDGKNFSLGTRVRRGIEGNSSGFFSAIKTLPDIHKRLQGVEILNLPAIPLIQDEDGANTLMYIDCPYLHETRTSKKLYEHEMTTKDHEELLDTICQCKGKVLISGYSNVLYVNKLWNWNLEIKNVPNRMTQGGSQTKKVECVWKNF